MHQTPLTGRTICIGLVHGAAIVPDDDVAIAPPVPVLILGLRDILEQAIEQSLALFLGHADDDFHAVRFN
jgi:hypothetical protein